MEMQKSVASKSTRRIKKKVKKRRAKVDHGDIKIQDEEQVKVVDVLEEGLDEQPVFEHIYIERQMIHQQSDEIEPLDAQETSIERASN